VLRSDLLLGGTCATTSSGGRRRVASLAARARQAHCDRLVPAVRPPTDNGRENRMAFLFKLETEDGAPPEPATLATAVPNWRSGGTEDPAWAAGPPESRDGSR
jgi:hypothetical protein